MEKQYPAPRPRLRATGGIVIGQGHTLTGRLPMAITDDPVRSVSRTPIYSYKGHQIWGFPWRVSGGFSVGPVVGPRARQLAAEWTGSIPSGGGQFWLIEEYNEDIISIGGDYYQTGHVTPTNTTITCELYGNTTDFNAPSTWGGITDPGPSSVTAAWLLSLVKEDDGAYYLCTEGGFPYLGLPSPMPVYPDDFDTDHPL